MRKLLAAVLIMVSSQAWGFQFDGNDLQTWVDADARVNSGVNSVADEISAARLSGYLAGVVDTDLFLTCIPNDMDLTTVKPVVAEYLKRNSENRAEFRASYFVVKALRERFPCPYEQDLARRETQNRDQLSRYEKGCKGSISRVCRHE